MTVLLTLDFDDDRDAFEQALVTGGDEVRRRSSVAWAAMNVRADATSSPVRARR